MNKQIAKTAVIEEGVQFFGSVTIGSKAFIGSNCIIGYTWNDEYIVSRVLKHTQLKSCGSSYTNTIKTIIGPEVWLHANCIICTGAKLRRGTWCDVGCFVGERTEIGEDSWLHYGVRVYNDVVIGSNCNIGGFICNRAVIGENVTMFGSLIHRLIDGYRRDGDRAVDDEPSPVIENDVFIGWGAVIIGGVTVGQGAKIGALSIITRNVKIGQKIQAGTRF